MTAPKKRKCPKMKQMRENMRIAIANFHRHGALVKASKIVNKLAPADCKGITLMEIGEGMGLGVCNRQNADFRRAMLSMYRFGIAIRRTGPTFDSRYAMDAEAAKKWLDRQDELDRIQREKAEASARFKAEREAKKLSWLDEDDEEPVAVEIPGARLIRFGPTADPERGQYAYKSHRATNRDFGLGISSAGRMIENRVL